MPANIAQAVQRIDAELNRRKRHRLALSTAATEKLELLYTEYLADIGQEAVRIARGAGLSTVDEAHVDAAAQRLAAGSSRHASFINVANAFGGVFAGGGIAIILAIAFTAGPHGLQELIAAIVLSVLGFCLLVAALTLTLARRP
jgi:histone H3/H4